MAFLNDPATVYPVTIDPPISFSVNADTWIQSDVTTAQNASTELRVGNPTVTTKTRSYLQWFLPNWSAANTRITPSRLAVTSRPSCVKWTLVTGLFPAGLISRIFLPLAMSHRMTLPSSLLLASTLESPRKQTEVMAALWSASV